MKHSDKTHRFIFECDGRAYEIHELLVKSGYTPLGFSFEGNIKYLGFNVINKTIYWSNSSSCNNGTILSVDDLFNNKLTAYLI